MALKEKGFPALITSARGLEEVAVLELKQLGIRARPRPFGLPGWVWVEEIEPIELARICYLARTIDRGLLVLAQGEIRRSSKGLEDIYHLMREVHWPAWLPEGRTFRVRGKRHGEHEFRSLDVHQIAGQAVVDQIRQRTGRRQYVNLKAPDVPLRVDISGTTAIVSLDFVGRKALHKRMPRSYSHPSALNPTIAAALVYLSKWLDEPGQLLWDPTCGGATIAIEAASLLRRIPAGCFRKEELAFTRLPLFAGMDWQVWFGQFDRRIAWERKAPILASDVSPRHLQGAVLNVEAARVSDTIELRCLDLLQIKDIPQAGGIITNPPYGIRSGSPRQAEKVHRALVEAADRSIQKGRFVAITPRTPWLAPLWLERGLRQIASYNIKSGDLPVQVVVLER